MRRLAKILMWLFMLNSITASAIEMRGGSLVQTLPELNNMPVSSVNTVLADHNDVMWLGTDNGLIRYDGQRANLLSNNFRFPNRFPSNNIICLVSVNESEIFIGTKDGMSILNTMDFKSRFVEFEDLNGVEIRKIIKDSDGRFWVATSIRLVCLSHDLTECNRYDTSLPVTSVNDIFIDSEGELYVAFWTKGLYRYNRGLDRFEQLPAIGEYNNPFRIFQDQTGRHFITLWERQSLYRFFPSKRPEDCGYEICVLNKPISNIFGITDLTDKNSLILLNGNVIRCYDISSDHPLEKRFHFDNLDQEQFYSISKTPDGTLWVGGSTEKLYKIEAEDNSKKYYSDQNSLNGFNIQAICRGQNDNIIIGQNVGGLSIYSKKYGISTSYLGNFTTFPQDQSLGNIAFILPHESGYWIAPKYRDIIYYSELHENNITAKRAIDITSIGSPVVAFEGDDGVLYIGGKRGIGRISTDYSFDCLTNHAIQPTAITGSGNKIWISNDVDGLIEYQNGIKDSTLSIPEISKGVESLSYDKKRNLLWIGTEIGTFYSLDVDKRDLTDYSGKISHIVHGKILNILTDKFGHLWISTPNEIVEYNPDTNFSRIRVSHSGRPIIFNKDACYYDGDSQMYFGGNNGIIAFDLNVKPAGTFDTEMPTVMISNIRIGSNSIVEVPHDGCSLDNMTHTVYLAADAENVEFGFSSGYSSTALNGISYRLNGKGEWIYLTEAQPYAYFNKIPRGNSTLELRQLMPDGNQVITTTYTVYKEPAWYETYWAFAIYTIIALAIVYALYLLVRRVIRNKNEETRIRMEKQKQDEIADAKMKYFTNVSHDFLTPITIIQCLVDDIQNTDKTPHSSLSGIKANLYMLKHMVQQILDFKRIDKGKIVLKVRDTEIESFMKELCLSHFMPLLRRKNITFEYNHDVSGVNGFVDNDIIKKFMLNLVSNAYKYTPVGGHIAIDVSKMIKDDATLLIIKISDTGVGIPKEDIPHIFDRFVSTKGFDSNGIGLSIVKELVTIHHGKISVESTVGKGTTFTVELPLSKGAYTENEFMDLNEQIIGPTELAISVESLMDDASETDERVYEDAKTILVVEDNTELQDIMNSFLSKNGYKVILSNNGAEALPIIAEKEIDLIISDVMMPQMDGWDLCKKIKTDIATSHIPVILLTAKNDSDSRVKAYSLGADSYIAKPFEVKVLLARIEAFFKKRETAQKELKENPEAKVDEIPKISDLDRKLLDKVVGIVKERITDETFDINALADSVAMSRPTLYRKIKSITGMSPVEFVINIKLKTACDLLATTDKTITEVSYETGFSQPKYFSASFKKVYGVTPSEYQKSARQN